MQIRILSSYYDLSRLKFAKIFVMPTIVEYSRNFHGTYSRCRVPAAIRKNLTRDGRRAAPLDVGRDQPGPNREANQAWDVMNAQPLHQLQSMRFNRLNANLQVGRDFLGVFPLAN